MAKLWLDDVRKPPDDSWTWCKSVDEAITLVSETDCNEWSLDHDLGGQLAHYGKAPYDYSALTGYDFCSTYCSSLTTTYKVPQRITIHSTSASGTARMVLVLHAWASAREADIEIIVRPMAGRIMDKTPYYEPALRA